MGDDVASVASYDASGRKKGSAVTGFLRRLAREKPLGLAGAIVTLVLVLVGICANFLAPYGMNATSLLNTLQAPSAQHLMGTDNLGRDVLSRVIYGARISMIVGLSASIIATTLCILIGMLSGYLGGKFDMIVQRFVDAWMCFPDIVLLMVIVSMMGAGLWQVIVVIGISWGISGSRVVRGAVIAIRENAYLESARATGCSKKRILCRHILPNIMAPIIIIFTTRVPNVILMEASLSFLGFGVPPPAASWGGMLSGDARAFMFQAPWMVFWPGLALSVAVYGINMFGDAVRDLIDPRMKGGGGRYGARKSKKLKRLLEKMEDAVWNPD